MPASSAEAYVDSPSMRSETNYEQAESLRKQIARDNRLWLLAFIAVLLVSAFIIWHFAKQDAEVERLSTMEASTARRATVESARHQAAAEQIRERLSAIGMPGAWVRFVEIDMLEVEFAESADQAKLPKAIHEINRITMQRLNSRPGIATYTAAKPGRGSRRPLDVVAE